MEAKIILGAIVVVAVFGLAALGLRRRWQKNLARERLAAELEQKRLATRLGLLMRYAKDIIFLGDATARLVDANEEAVATYGWTREELRNMTVEDFRAPEGKHEISQNVERVNEAGAAIYETVHRRKDGTTFPVEVRAQRVELEGEVHALCVVRDITERRRQQQRIAQLGRMYRVLSRINEVIFRATDKAGLFPQACQAIVESGGFQLAWIGWHDPFSHTIRPVARHGEMAEQVAGSVIETKDCAEGRGTGGTAFREKRTEVCNDIRNTPSMAPWRQQVETAGVRSSIAIPIRERGEVQGLLMVYDRTKDCFGPEEVALLEEAAANLSVAVDMFAERERRRLIEERYRLIADNTSDVVWLADVRTRKFAYVSPAIRRARGYGPEEIEGGVVGQFAVAETAKAIQEELDRRIAAFNRGELADAHHTYEVTLPHKDGSLRQTEVLTTLLAGADGQAAIILGVNRDITERKQAALRLQQAEELYRGIFEGAPMGIYRVAPTGETLAANDALARIFGYGSGDAAMAAVTDASRRIWRDPAVRRAYEDELNTNGVVRNLECEMRRTDGENIWVSVTARAVRGPDGAIRFYEGFVEDISERRRLELSVRESERLLTATFEQASVGIAYTDATLAIQRSNRRLREMLECTEGDLRQGDFRRFVRGDDYATQQARMEEVRDRRLEGFALEIRFTRKEGTFFWGNLSATALRQKSGDVAGYVVILDDITERRVAREALIQFNQELEARVAARTAELAARNTEMQGLMGSIPDTVLLCDRKGGVVFSHLPRPEERPPLIARGFAGEQWADTDPALRELVAKVLAAVEADGGTAVRDFDFPENGQTVSLEARAAVIESDRVLIVLRDISARKQIERDIQANLERERQLSGMKSQFLAIASHEFRTPLAAALGSLELLERHAATISEAKRADLLARSQRSLNRLTAIINDVLSVGRIESGRVTVQRMAIDLPRFVQDVIRELELGDRQQHRLVFERTGGPEIVATDSSLLHHILSNLVGNALRYSPAGTTVTVTLALAPEAFALTVADEGIGIPAEERERVFEPFVRGSNVGAIGGTGLGLNIVKRYAELMGGRIELLPTGQGAAFRIHILTPVDAKES